MRRNSRRRGYREMVEGDLEIMPLMNLFVALIPMLLISAVFLNVTVIDMHLPTDASAAQLRAKQALQLSVAIHDGSFVVEGRNLKRRVVDRDLEDPDAELALVLQTIKTEHPENQDIMIISEPQTLYDVIIQVMDISREAGLSGVSLLGANDVGEV